MNYDISIERDADGQAIAMYFSPAPIRPKLLKLKRGDKVKGFASWEWQKTGDIGDNSCFYKPATVLHFYQKDGDYLVDLLFDCGRVSHGHFAYGIRPLDS